jgi:hypothetical protein
MVASVDKPAARRTARLLDAKQDADDRVTVVVDEAA